LLQITIDNWGFNVFQSWLCFVQFHGRNVSDALDGHAKTQYDEREARRTGKEDWTRWEGTCRWNGTGWTCWDRLEHGTHAYVRRAFKARRAIKDKQRRVPVALQELADAAAEALIEHAAAKARLGDWKLASTLKYYDFKNNLFKLMFILSIYEWFNFLGKSLIKNKHNNFKENDLNIRITNNINSTYIESKCDNLKNIVFYLALKYQTIIFNI